MLKQVFILVFGLIALNVQALNELVPNKKVIGPTAIFSVYEQAEFEARIDTGAATTSIHAIDIEVEDGSDDMVDNVGKIIHFTIENDQGEQWRTSAKISQTKAVRNSQGVETRYLVPLRLGWNNINKTIDVNLRDRSSMQYKLLIGRDWMAKEVVVDLEHEEPEQ
ncbi:MAG: ATP-dependent zinc protease [Pseudomonadales bacterium]|nr:ATP-dependent zinc protease [Pseudomonadales bacterium]